MLECRTYTYSELSKLFQTRDTQGIKRRLEHWDVLYETKGRGASKTFTIQKIDKPFEMYCMLDLGFSPQTDFQKLALFLYYLFNDDEFAGLPCERMEARINADDLVLSRQTIDNYLQRLNDNNLILRASGEYHYYFAKKGNLIDTTKEEFNQAWSEYWQARADGCPTRDAIGEMCWKYGGVARKQAIILFNGIYGKELDKLNDMVCERIEQMGSANM